MVLVNIKPNLLRLLISYRENEIRDETFSYLEDRIKDNDWDKVPPIWTTPNFILNGLLNGITGGDWHPTLKPLIVYNGNHRLKKAMEHKLPLKVYIRYTPKNPSLPKSERLFWDIPY